MRDVSGMASGVMGFETNWIGPRRHEDTKKKFQGFVEERDDVGRVSKKLNKGLCVR